MSNNNNELPVMGVCPLDQMIGGDDEDTALLRMMAAGAENFIKCFPWCKNIRGSYFGDGYGGIVAVFLFFIETSGDKIDEWHWVVFGDVPPAFISVNECKAPSHALKKYVAEMTRWVEMARAGCLSKDLIPVYVPATAENSDDIERRLKFITEVIIPAFREAEINKQ